MKSNYLRCINKKVLPLSLAALMMLNITGEVFAQSVSLEELKREHSDRLASVLEEKWQEQEYAMRDTIPPYNPAEMIGTREYFNKYGDRFYDISLKNPNIRRAEEISYIIWARAFTTPKGAAQAARFYGKKQKNEAGVSQSYKATGVPFLAYSDLPAAFSSEEFSAEYKKNLNEQYQKSVAKINKHKEQEAKSLEVLAESYIKLGKYEEAAIQKWQEESLSALSDWQSGSVEKINAEYKKQIAATPARFKSYMNDYKKADKENYAKNFATLKKLGNELISLYNKDPQHLLPYIISVTPMLLVARCEGQKIFSDRVEEQLLAIYLDIINKEGDSCEKYGYCDEKLNAVMGVGILGRYQDEAMAVEGLIERTVNNPRAAEILMAGVSAILMTKQYQPLAVLFRNMGAKEKDTDATDWLSFTAPVNYFATIRGKYLGEVTKNYQYALPSGVIKNAWTDVALILAAEGSEQSLKLLRDFGIQKCYVTKKETNLNKEYSLACNGIKPFLVGALLSGKSGAENYTIPFERAGTSYFTDNGRVADISAQQASASASRAKTLERNFTEYAAAENISKQALVARALINYGMGDLDAKSEESLDKELYKTFGGEIAPKTLGDYAVIDNKRLSTKESRQNRTAIVKGITQIGDVAFAVWCLWDMSLLAIKGLSAAAKGASVGVKLFKGISIARYGTELQRIAYLRGNIAAYRSLKAGKLAAARFTAKFKNALEPVVLGQRSLYTSAPLPAAALAAAPKSTVVVSLENTAFNAAKGTFAVNTAKAYAESYGQTNRVLDLQRVKKIIKESEVRAYEAQSKHSLNKVVPYRKYFENAFNHKLDMMKSKFSREDIMAGKAWAYVAGGDKTVKFNKEFATLTAQKNVISFISARNPDAPVNLKNMELFLDDGSHLAAPLPIEMGVEGKIPGIKTDDLSRLLLQKKDDGSYWLKFVDGENKLIDPNFFKIGVEQASMPALIKAATETTLEGPLNLKFMPLENGVKNFFTVKAPNFFKSKSALWGGKGMIYTRYGSGALKETGITLQTSRKYDGVQAVLEENGLLNIYTKDQMLLKRSYGFSLPKNQLGNLVALSPKIQFSEPLRFSLTGAKQKINALFFVNAISLSAASTGLVGHLNANFRKEDGTGITDSQVFQISVILPYAPSIFSPVIYPFVKRFGSINVLKASMMTSLAAVSFPILFGYSGFGNIEPNKPDNPPLWPLFISAGLIGVSASLTRSSFNPLMNAVGGGGNLLKSMAFKNVSSFAMVVPPVAMMIFGTKEAKKQDGSIKTDSEGNPIKIPKTDFSLSYPVLASLVLGSLVALQGVRLSSSIGKVEGFKFSEGFKGLQTTSVGAKLPSISKGLDKFYAPALGLWKETKLSMGSVIKKETLPIIAGSTLVLGAEASLFNSYGMSEANNNVAGDFSKSNDIGMMLLGGSAAGIAGYSLFKNKGILNLFNAKNHPLVYKGLFGASSVLGVAGIGATGYYGYDLFFKENKSGPKENPLVPFWATTFAALAPFFVRFKAKPLLKLVGGENNPMAYKRLLTGSILAAGTGGYILANQDSPLEFYAGLALTSIGFANTTNTFLKIGRYNIGSAFPRGSKIASNLKTNLDVVYPGVHVGMAFIPQVYSSFATRKVESLKIDNDEQKSKAKRASLQEYLWIPMASLGTGGLFALKGMGILPAFKRFPSGVIGTSKLLLGGENIFNPAPIIAPVGNDFNGEFKNFQPSYFGTEGYLSKPLISTDLKLRPAARYFKLSDKTDFKLSLPPLNGQTSQEQPAQGD